MPLSILAWHTAPHNSIQQHCKWVHWSMQQDPTTKTKDPWFLVWIAPQWDLVALSSVRVKVWWIRVRCGVYLQGCGKTKKYGEYTQGVVSSRKVWWVCARCGEYAQGVVSSRKVWWIHSRCGEYTRNVMSTCRMSVWQVRLVSPQRVQLDIRHGGYVKGALRICKLW